MANARLTKSSPGTIVAIPLRTDLTGYGLVLKKPLMEFYDFFTKDIQVPNVSDLTPAFRIWVMRRALGTKSPWLRVAHIEPPVVDEYFFKQDSGSHRLTKVQGSNEIPISYDEAKELECAAVWSACHVEERLRDLKAGKVNRFWAAMRPKNLRPYE